MTIIKETLDAYATSLKKEWSHDRSETVGASEIGACARRTWFVKRGPQVSEAATTNYGAALRGNLIEDNFWVPAMRKKYAEAFMFSGSDQRTLADGFLSATPDGLLVDLPRDFLSRLDIDDIESDCVLAECKSIDPRVDLRKEKEQHAFQVQVQLGLMNEKTNYKPKYAIISYIDASFLHEVSEFVIKYDPRVFEQAKVRAKQILTTESPEDLEPEGWILGGNECNYCPFVRICNALRQDVPEEDKAPVSIEVFEEVKDLCSNYFNISTAIEDAENTKRRLQEEIKQKLRDSNVRKIPGLVTWSSQKGRQSYDMKALKEAAVAAGIDIEKFSTVGDATDRLLVNYKG